MQCVSELYVDEGAAAAVSYNFLHLQLTVQEHLAALLKSWRWYLVSGGGEGGH